MKLKHYTDVGSPSGNGADSTKRILDQYEHLGVDAEVVNAGTSPLHIAFTGTTILQSQARIGALKIKELLGEDTRELLPVALNCAPRNAEAQKSDAAEDYIYRVQSESGRSFLLYGPEVLNWTATFAGRANIVIDRILSIDEIIPNTSKGSQFRSAEYLPVAHYLQARGKLDNFAKNESIDSVPDRLPKDQEMLILPPDEYGNGRILVNRSTFEEVLKARQLAIAGIDAGFMVEDSLTSVSPGTLSVWPSSNYFPNDDLRVLNIGTRWKPGTTTTTDAGVINLAKKLSAEIGTSYPFSLQ